MKRYSVERWERGYVEWFVHCREKQNKGLMAWGTGWDGWPILPLWPSDVWTHALARAMYESVVLPETESVLMSMYRVITQNHEDTWGLGHHQGPWLMSVSNAATEGHTRNCHQRPWWHPGSSCGWGACLRSWSYCSWDLCWSPWPVLPWGPLESWPL